MRSWLVIERICQITVVQRILYSVGFLGFILFEFKLVFSGVEIMCCDIRALTGIILSVTDSSGQCSESTRSCRCGHSIQFNLFQVLIVFTLPIQGLCFFLQIFKIKIRRTYVKLTANSISQISFQNQVVHRNGMIVSIVSNELSYLLVSMFWGQRNYLVENILIDGDFVCSHFDADCLVELQIDWLSIPCVLFNLLNFCPTFRIGY